MQQCTVITLLCYCHRLRHYLYYYYYYWAYLHVVSPLVCSYDYNFEMSHIT